MADVNTEGRPELPDLVIHEILRRLPTKAAVGMSLLSKQWEGILSCVPTLDFDVGKRNKKLEQHHKFVNMLQRCLLVCNNEKEKQVLDKFRLRMTNYYLCGDAIAVTKWLSYSFERSVKEVDISLRVRKAQQGDRDWPKKYYYCLSRTNFVNAKTLTCLSLEYVSVGLKNTRISLEPLLPSLKKMSFKTVHFDNDALSYLIKECPAVEHLSLIKSSFAGIKITVSSSSLKSIEIKHCKATRIHVHKAVNLESVTVVSPKPHPLVVMFLLECFSLKCISIHAWRMKGFYLHGSHDVKGTIIAPNLVYFSFEGYLKSKLSLRAPNLRSARIVLLDIWGEESSSSFDQQPWKHFPKLTEFLKEFGSSKKMVLFLHDFRALIFPKDFRRTLSSSVLPSVEILEFWMDTVVPANERSRDAEDLIQSLQWMAPLATDIGFVHTSLK